MASQNLSLSTLVGVNGVDTTLTGSLNLTTFETAWVTSWVSNAGVSYSSAFFVQLQGKNKLEPDTYIFDGDGGTVDDLVTLLTGVTSGVSAKKFTSVKSFDGTSYIAAKPATLVVNTLAIEEATYDGTNSTLRVKGDQQLSDKLIVCAGDQTVI